MIPPVIDPKNYTEGRLPSKAEGPRFGSYRHHLIIEGLQ